MPYLGNEVAPLVQALEGKELKLDADGDSSIQASTDDTVVFKTNGSNRWTLNSSGNLFPASTSQGIVLGATSDTSANRLDDYEEGTWTPGVIGSGTAGSFSGGSVSGNYTKIGNSVAVWFGVTGTQSGASGSLTITGLPFTSKSGVEAIGQLMWSSLNVSGSAVNFVFYIGGDSTSMVIFQSYDDTAWGTLNVSNEEFALRGQLNYLV